MKYTALQAFQKHLESAKANFLPVYLIIGSDSFARREAIESLLKEILKDQKESHLCVKTLKSEQATADKIQIELQSFSFFSSKEILHVADVDALPKATHKLLEAYFEHPNANLILILSASGLNANTNFYKKAEKIGVILDLPEEKPWQKEKTLTEWLLQEAAKAGKSIKPQVCQQLVKQVGADQSLLYNELQKLLCYVDNRPEITLQDIHSISVNLPQETIWQLGEALLKRDASQALSISKAIFQQEDNLIGLIRQIRYQFQNAYQIASVLSTGGGPQQITELFPYMKGNILEKNINQARAYGINQFKASMLAIDAAELQAKNSSMDPSLLLDRLIVRLLYGK